MESVRAKFVACFSEEQATKIVAAAEGHKNGVHDRPGSDHFKWALCMCIGHECLEREVFRKEHGITIPFEVLKTWIRDEADLASHDGDVDYIALFLGKYGRFLKVPDRRSFNFEEGL